jgi:hypothetical protein
MLSWCTYAPQVGSQPQAGAAAATAGSQPQEGAASQHEDLQQLRSLASKFFRGVWQRVRLVRQQLGSQPQEGAAAAAQEGSQPHAGAAAATAGSQPHAGAALQEDSQLDLQPRVRLGLQHRGARSLQQRGVRCLQQRVRFSRQQLVASQPQLGAAASAPQVGSQPQVGAASQQPPLLKESTRSSNSNASASVALAETSIPTAKMAGIIAAHLICRTPKVKHIIDTKLPHQTARPRAVKCCRRPIAVV